MPQSAWYWIVGGQDPPIYSSAGGAYVAVTDPGYLDFLAGGNVPTSIASDALLQALLADTARGLQYHGT